LSVACRGTILCNTIVTTQKVGLVMEWTFSTELDYQGNKVEIYFFQAKENKETFFKALPYPKGVLSPFTMKLDDSDHGYKIMEDCVPVAIKEYELIFSVNLLNLSNHLGFKDVDNMMPN
jgi:hypothetical protein